MDTKTTDDPNNENDDFTKSKHSGEDQKRWPAKEIDTVTDFAKPQADDWPDEDDSKKNPGGPSKAK